VRRRLTSDDAFETKPAWSPDGKRIAFKSRRDGQVEVYMVRADGTEQTRLTVDSGVTTGTTDWSPDGQTIVFASDRDGEADLYAIDVSTGMQERLTSHPGPEWWTSWGPRK
jgi:TolB protein